MLLGDVTWTGLEGRAPTLVVPVGSVEQHGPHLPTSVDVRVAEAVAAGLHDRDADLLLAPALAYGAAGEHEGFPGTVSIGHDALYALLLEYGRSACRWAGRLLFVNGHGGNVATLVAAVTRLRYEARDVAWLACVPSPDAGVPLDAHAGRVETSLMLAIAPHLVRTRSADAGATEPLSALLERVRDGGVAAVSPNGVLGDPAGASGEEGGRLLAAMIDTAAASVYRWVPDPDSGRLTAAPG